MSKESEPDLESSGSGLLSRVVKFVKSPTTRWSDLDRSHADSDDMQSRQELKEMIERKKRNDFVRNREFDTLRKLRRKETLTEKDLRPGPASFFTSSQPAGGTDERARTLKKIDEIEAQMANAWFRRKGDQALQQASSTLPGRVRAGATDAAPPPSQPQSQPQPAATAAATAAPAPAAAAPAPNPAAARAFAPTVPMAYAERQQLQKGEPPAAAPTPAHAHAHVHAAPPPAHGQIGPVGAMPAAPDTIVEAPRPKPAPMPVFGDMSDFQVEVVAGAKLPPAIEEAAIRYANGDAAGAEAGLCELVAAGGSHEDDVDTWLTLFDLYRLMGQQGQFDDAALNFAARFGRSAPQWGAEAGAGSSPMSIHPAAPVRNSTAKFHWTCPAALNAAAVVALEAALRRYAPPWRVDWRALKSVDAAALPALQETFQRWAEAPVQLRFVGVEVLLEALAKQSPAENRDVDPLWWKTRLALLRALGEMEEFDLVALNYCVTYEVSPPAWEDPKNGYSPVSEEGHTIIGQEQDELAEPPETAPPSEASSHHFGHSDFMADSVSAPDGAVTRADLTGELLTAAADALKQIKFGLDTRAIDLNCGELRRVDFGAAGDLLNWAMEQKAAGRQVSFRQVNRLVAAFFGVIGITEAARVILRVD
jgi:ABC-type transporter Mla MlaB component